MAAPTPLFEIEVAPNLEDILRTKKERKLPILDTLSDYYETVRKSVVELTQHPVIVYEREERGPYEIITPKRWIVVEQRSLPPFILCSDRPLMKGTVEGFLKPLDTIGDCLGVGVENIEKLKALLKITKLDRDPAISELLEGLKEAGQNEESIVGTVMGAKPSSFKMYKLETFIPEVGEFTLRHWEEFKEELFKAYDPWIRGVYRAYLTPFPSAGLAPHAFLITPSGVGKSTLADSIGEEWDDVTVASLVGGYYDGKVRIGLLHGKDYLVQIGKFESGDKDALGHLHKVLAVSESSRAAGARRIRVVFKGAVIFTNNANVAVDVPLIELVSKLSNPVALGTRFIPLINTRVVYASRTLTFNTHAVREALEAVRALVRRKVRVLYLDRRVREWFEEEPEDWEDLRMRIIEKEIKDENLKAYLRSFAKEGWRRVKALAFGRAVSERLDEIWMEQVTPQSIINTAESYLGDLGSGYLYMIRGSIDDVELQLKEELERIAMMIDREKFLDYLLDTLVELVKHDLEAQTKDYAELDITEVRKLVEARAKADGKTWKYSIEKFTQKLERLKRRPETRILMDLIGMEVREGKVIVRAHKLINTKMELDRLRE